MTIIDIPVILRIRRNHGLEHATLGILSQKFPYRPLAGYSFPGGFIVLGNVAAADLRQAAGEALVRLRNGERHLAVHPNCGTNYLTSGLAAGLLAWLGMWGANDPRSRRERLPLVLWLVTVALVLTHPLGLLVQKRITTAGDPGGLQIVDVFPVQLGKLRLHRVTTRG